MLYKVYKVSSLPFFFLLPVQGVRSIKKNLLQIPPNINLHNPIKKSGK